MSTDITTLTAGASYESDWHVYITDPERGPLGYCIGAPEEWEPETATAHLAEHGWQVVGEWRETPPAEEYQYVADVVRVDASA